jgi:competence protein ComEC
MILYLLWENPFLLEYAGFTLSVAAVLGVATVGAAIQIGEREEKLDMTRVEMEDESESEELRGKTEHACRSKKNRVIERAFQTEKNGSSGITSCEKAQRDKKSIRTSSDGQMTRGTAEGNMYKLMNAGYMGVGIWLFTLPLIAYYYYEIPLYSALLNLFVVPLLKYLILLGVVGAVVGVAGSAGVASAVGVAGSADVASEVGVARTVGVPSAMRVFAAGGYAIGVTEGGMPDTLQKIVSLILLPCQWILSWYDTAATACLNLPFAQIIVGKPSVGRMILYYTAIAFFAMIWSKQKGRHWIRLIGIATIFAVLLIPSEKTFEVDILDVGQGDGTYICTEEGISMFIDGGSSNVSSVGTYQILPFLKSKGIREISYWFVSHADADHISGLLEVMESGYQIDNLIVANRNVQDDSRDSLLELALADNINVICMKTGDILTFGQTQMICLSPDADNLYEDRNDGGLVLLYKDEQFSGMFAGDIPGEVEDTIVAQMDILNVDFYKADHHGSKYSSSERWLSALTPKVTSISCSSTNTYGHPHEQTLERLSEVGTEIYRTDELGAIKITLEDGRIKVANPME